MREFSKLILCLAGAAGLTAAASGQVVISQLYGGGGNTGATYTNDFIELFNKGAAPVDLSGWAIQYASATGTSWNADIITAGTIQPGGYFLIQFAGGANGGALPTPDHISDGLPNNGIINMGGGAGKVALTSNSTPLAAGTCVGSVPTDPAIVDFVGYGSTATCFEGSDNAPGVTGNGNALFRAADGCTDADDNASDFAVAPVAPRNTSSPTTTCSSSTPPTGVGNTVLNACPQSNVLLTITVTPGDNPPSTGITVTGDTTQIGGFAGEVFVDDGTFGDVTAGDNVFSLATTVFTANFGFKSIPAAINDLEGRTGNATATVQVINCSVQGFGSASSACPGENTLITVAATPGQNPPSTGLAATADLTAIGGPASQPLFDDGTNGDVTAGDNTFSYSYAIPGGHPQGTHALTATVSDNEARTANLNFSIYTGACIPSDSAVVISQGYGGGGNTGATLTHDFIELFNRSGSPVDISGWSVQYASGENDTNGFDQATEVPGGTILPPGGYYLVQQAAGAGGTDPLPTPDLIGAIALGAGRGTFALVSQAAPLGLTACDNPLIVDMVGIGNGAAPSDRAYCAEGTRTPTTSNPVGVIRRDGGCFDTDDNAMDFAIASPTPRNSASPANPCVTGPVCGTADFDGDGDTGTDADIEAFFACLAGNCCPTCFAGGADFNADGDVGTDADIESFFRVLGGGPC